jgi:bifunctional non-homologous end joining protein LigD
VLDYYARAAPALLPHLAGRPVTLRRFPEGVHGPNWFQTECRDRPEWLPVRPVAGRRGGVQRYCMVNDLPALIWAANLAAIELHPLLAPEDRPAEPAAAVFDLDPGDPADVVDCCRVALWLRDLLDGMGLACFPKTSGSKGLHVYVPLGGGERFERTKAFARRVARLLAERNPDHVVERQAVPLRAGKVLVDWLQNDPSRSTVAPYSLRGMAWPMVSTPLGWDEVEAVAASGRLELLTFEPHDVLERLDRLGELFAPVLHVRQRLPPG